MKNHLLFCALPFAISCACATESCPQDFTKFLAIADDCLHLAGEWDSSLPDTQKKHIEKQVDIVCEKARIQQKVLRARYRDRKDLVERIDEYDF